MSNINSVSVDGFFEVLRQRLFLDHSPEAKTFVNDEYTIRCNTENLTNIILDYPDFLPNLNVYDSDGEELPILPKSYVNTLLHVWINKSKDDAERNKFLDLLREIDEGTRNLIWIKLPEEKALKINEIKLFTLEYGTQKEESNGKDYVLKIISPDEHSVYHIIKVPEDHNFANQKIILSDVNGHETKMEKNWKKHNDLINVVETHDSLFINPNPKVTQSISLTYSFKAKWPVISFPVSVLVFLFLGSLYLFYLNFCPDCTSFVFDGSNSILLKKIEISLSIIAASLVLPRLIKNDYVRHDLLIWYFVPIVISIITIVF